MNEACKAISKQMQVFIFKAFLLICFIFFFGNATALGGFFSGIGDLPGGGLRSDVRGVSPDGQFVFGTSPSELSPVGPDATGGLGEAFIWSRDGGLQGLGNPPGFVPPGGRIIGISKASNRTGTVITGTYSLDSGTGISSPSEAFLWSHDEGFMNLGLLPPGFASMSATDISSDGAIVVGEARARRADGIFRPVQAFRWTEQGGYQLLQNLDGIPNQSTAFAVSADGLVTVGYAFSDDIERGFVQEAVQWTSDGKVMRLGDLPGGRADSLAFDVSADGSIVVGEAWSTRGREAFYWTETTGMIGLGDIPGGLINGIARAVSADGNIVVGSGSGEDGGAMIWDPIHGGRSLARLLVDNFDLSGQLEGWELSRAVDVSADGKTIVGNGVNPQGQQEGWVAVLDDLPAPELRPGDIDLDGVVSLSDFTILKEHFGVGGFRYQGDLDGDFDVDLEDFIIVKSHFGEGAAQVPEPATWVLLVIAMIGWLGCRAEARRCFGC